MNTLSISEARLFDRKMAEENFQRLYTQEKAIFEEINQAGRTRIKDELVAMESDLSSGTKPNNRLRTIWWSVAASILLISTVVIYQFTRASSTEELYASYYQKFPNLVDPINKAEENGRTAFQLYEIGSYKEALQALNEMSGGADKDIYTALCHFELGNMNEAIGYLRDIALIQDHAYKQEAEWFLVLALIKDKDVAQARQLLEMLTSDPDGFYYHRSMELLEKLTDQ